MSDPTASTASRAVFLSYAHEDGLAARRIAEALREAGIEVWFDQSELRGGDAWDQKIRRQIKECALFVPIVSANTQARGEGYFRLEWKLAVERTHHMAEGIPFLAPVALDRSHEADALVPPEFMRVHWTRLGSGEPTPEFVDQIKRVLDAPRKSTTARKAESAGSKFVAASAASAAPVSPPPAASVAPAGTPRPPRAWPSLWFTVGPVVAALAVLGYVMLRPAAKESSGAAAPAMAATKSAPPVMAAHSIPTDKSIAVLPFENLSEVKDDNAFFADGVQEDILTSLAAVHELRVISRTSVERYRKTTKAIPQIARELGVAYLLEGSVRRAGNKVRVTGQLIRAATDDHVWAKAYDRDLSDIFAIQSELAQAIVGELKAALSPAEADRVTQQPTENLAAYDLYLRARDILLREGAFAIPEQAQESIRLARRAVEIDPKFARAWVVLSEGHAQLIEICYDASDARIAQARAAVDTALTLAPNLREARLASAGLDYSIRDYARAAGQIDWVIEHYPQDADAWRWRGFIQRRAGRWNEALATLLHAQELDPGNVESAQNVALHYCAMRRYDEARPAYRRVSELEPGLADAYWVPAGVSTLDFHARGSTAEGDAYFAALSASELAQKGTIVCRKNWALVKGDLAGFEQLETLSPDADFSFLLGQVLMIRRAAPAAVRARLQPYVTQLRADLEREPRNPYKWAFLGQAEAVLGEPAAAIRDGEKACAVLPLAKDAFYGRDLHFILSSTYAWSGEADSAIAELTACVHTPPSLSIHQVRHHPAWWPLHDDPRFRALVAEPGNNAPFH